VVEEVAPGAYRVATPDPYKLNHDVFNVADIRPWLSHESHALHVDCPPVVPHPALNPVVQVLDRRRGGRAPRNCDLLDIPTEDLVLFVNGDIAWRKKYQVRGT
jgi:hypothetical protein